MRRRRNFFRRPMADALTHVGQIAMLRRVAGGPVKGENYFAADIVIGAWVRSRPRPSSNSNDALMAPPKRLRVIWIRKSGGPWPQRRG